MSNNNEKLIDGNQEQLNQAYQNYSLAQKREIFNTLGKDLTQIKNIINSNVDELARSEVFHCLGFFTRYNPGIAKKLLEFLEKGDVKGFIELSYANIYEDLNKVKDRLPNGLGTKLSPGKEIIDNSIEILKSKQEDIDSDDIQRLDSPSVHTGLLNTDWVNF